MKQTIGNACGTIGLLHCLGNNCAAADGGGGPLRLAPGSFLADFFARTRELDPAARGAYLESPPEGAPSIDTIHEEAAHRGATAAPPPDADVDLHFVAFVARGGRLWECDGRKAGPVDHGPTEVGSLLADTAAVVKNNFVEKAGASLNFSLVALAPAQAGF
jgi:ubiquitin carboxyl-terminal hydrolase L3